MKECSQGRRDDLARCEGSESHSDDVVPMLLPYLMIDYRNQHADVCKYSAFTYKSSTKTILTSPIFTDTLQWLMFCM